MQTFPKRTVTAVGTTAEIGDIAVSASCGGFLAVPGGYVAVTNLSVTLKTGGGAIRVMMVPVPSASVFIGDETVTAAESYSQISMRALRGAVNLGNSDFLDYRSASGIPTHKGGGTEWLDLTCPKGTYTFSIEARQLGPHNGTISGFYLVAYEL